MFTLEFLNLLGNSLQFAFPKMVRKIDVPQSLLNKCIQMYNVLIIGYVTLSFTNRHPKLTLRVCYIRDEPLGK